EFEETTVVSQLIDGDFFRIDHMLLTDFETKITLNKKDFLDKITRANLLVSEVDKKPLILNITDGQMDIKITSARGSYDGDLAITKEGRDIMIGFNPKFFIEALRVIDDEWINIYMVSPKAPCFIRDDAQTYNYLILPVNFTAA
ncbi:MAG: DNA polymerase III subunit beta, partial [Lachnospiraceae bacterium]|nr:DNA polymerase III subunit beta [Lachnospiraceae bacterium]